MLDVSNFSDVEQAAVIGGGIFVVAVTTLIGLGIAPTTDREMTRYRIAVGVIWVAMVAAIVVVFRTPPGSP